MADDESPATAEQVRSTLDALKTALESHLAAVEARAGENDPRFPKSEAEQVAEMIKKNGGTVRLKIYDDEGHSFGKWEDVVDHFKRVSDFLKVQVPSPGCGCELP